MQEGNQRFGQTNSNKINLHEIKNTNDIKELQILYNNFEI